MDGVGEARAGRIVNGIERGSLRENAMGLSWAGLRGMVVRMGFEG